MPLLELDDGTRISEASVILQYVAGLKSGAIAPAFGTLPRWKLMEWLAFISTEVRERTVQALGNRFTFIAKTLESQPYLTGQEFSIADAYLFVMSNWSALHKVNLSPWPALTAFQARVAARPAVQATLRAEGFIE